MIDSCGSVHCFMYVNFQEGYWAPAMLVVWLSSPDRDRWCSNMAISRIYKWYVMHSIIEPGSEKISPKWKSSIWICWHIRYFLLCMSMKDTQNCIKTKWNALILLRLTPRINHFPLLITSKGFCKQCIHMS